MDVLRKSNYFVVVFYLDYWVVQPDDDSGFQDDVSVAYGENSHNPVQITAYKTKTWGCFTPKKQESKEREEKGRQKIGLSEWSARTESFLHRATKKIIGKTRRIIGNFKPEEEKKAATQKQKDTKLKENQTPQVVNIILPANSSTSINEDLVDDGKVNFFRADPLRSPFRESRSSRSSRESREPHPEDESLQRESRSRNSFQRADLTRCSIRGLRDSVFLESRDSLSRVSLKFIERQPMLRVLFEFQACDDDEIAVRRGELVKVLNKDDQDWWWVENAHGEQGFVPRNFLWPCGCHGKEVGRISFY